MNFHRRIWSFLVLFLKTILKWKVRKKHPRTTQEINHKQTSRISTPSGSSRNRRLTQFLSISLILHKNANFHLIELAMESSTNSFMHLPTFEMNSETIVFTKVHSEQKRS